MKSFRQLNTNDCGPTCIRIICSYFKNEYSLRTIRKFCGVTSKLGISVYDLISGLKKIGFNATAVKVNLNELDKMPLPAILYWKQEHFVVLYKTVVKSKNKVYYIADPEFGKIKLSSDIFKNAFLGNTDSGIGIVIDPTEVFFKNKDENKHTHIEYKELLRVLKDVMFKYRRKFILSIFFTVVAMVTNWAIPIVFQKIIDDGIGGRNFNIVNILAVAQFILFFSYIVSNNIANIFLSKIGYSLGINILTDYLHKIIKLPISFFDTKINSDFIQMVDDQENLRSFFVYNLIEFVLVVANIFVFSLILFQYNSIVFIVFMIFALISLLWSFLFIKRREELNYSRFYLSSESKNDIYELITGMTEIKINNAENTKITRVEKTQSKINSVQLKMLHVNYFNTLGVLSFSKIKDVMIIVFCANSIIMGNMTLGVLMSISYLLGQLSEPFNKLIGFLKVIQEAKISMERLLEIQMEKNENETVDKNDLLTTFSSSRAISINNLSFKYPGSHNPYVLKNINIDIPVNRVTAIVGSSGSGKTTLLKLLLRFYDASDGDIRIDDNNISKINTEEWRRKCGVVMQDGKIFNGTIAENIAVADENPDMQNVKNVASIACIDKFICSLPKGYDTKIGNTGIELSKGQYQRILIARALYKNPQFLFFDEATSFLDTNNEKDIVRNLENIYENKTIIIIAHRLSTVRRADIILVLDNGYLVENGTHDQLIKQRGYYFNLIKNQLELNP